MAASLRQTRVSWRNTRSVRSHCLRSAMQAPNFFALLAASTKFIHSFALSFIPSAQRPTEQKKASAHVRGGHRARNTDVRGIGYRVDTGVT